MSEVNGTFYISKPDAAMDALLDPQPLARQHRDYYGPKLDAIKELREADDGTGHKGQEFRRVASFINVPMFQAATTILDPDFLRDKRKFYAFMDRHREYLTYDRRWQGGEQPKVRTPEPLNLKQMGLDYDGAPESGEGWDPVEVEVPLASDVVAE